MGNRHAALHLAEDICYNLRRVWGPLDKTALEMSSLLAEMYTAAGQYAKAMAVHEEVSTQLSDQPSTGLASHLLSIIPPQAPVAKVS
jgi:hypothetical protein